MEREGWIERRKTMWWFDAASISAIGDRPHSSCVENVTARATGVMQ